MSELDVGTAILPVPVPVSVSGQGTTSLPNAADAAALARELNEQLAAVVAARPDRFGFFSDDPHAPCAADEAVRHARRRAVGQRPLTIQSRGFIQDSTRSASSGPLSS